MVEYYNEAEYYCKECFNDKKISILLEKFDLEINKINYHFVCDGCPKETDIGYEIIFSVLKNVKSKNDRKYKKHKRHKQKGIVYVLHSIINGISYYKIGKTKNIQKRIKSFPVDYPIKTEIKYLFESDDISLLERELHEKFEDKRKEGEWFTLNISDLKYLDKIQNISNENIKSI